MPGLKILSYHIEGRTRSRYVAFYTAAFGLGTSGSLLLTGTLAPLLGWRTAFVLLALGPLIAGLLVVVVFPPRRPRAHPPRWRSLLDFRPVLNNRAATSYIVAYAAHCWELFGLRSWMVAFFAFSASLQAGASPIWSAAAAAAAINLLGPVASILGNEVASRYGRRRVVAHIMRSSAVMALIVGFAAPLPWLVVFALMSIYFLLVMGDSAALTAGLVTAAEPERRGATMALHSFLGFGAGFVAPLVFGVVLDLAGGSASVLAWGLAFASLGAGSAVGPLGFALYVRRARNRHFK
jgi:MFS family permease